MEGRGGCKGGWEGACATALTHARTRAHSAKRKAAQTRSGPTNSRPKRRAAQERGGPNAQSPPPRARAWWTKGSNISLAFDTAMTQAVRT